MAGPKKRTPWDLYGTLTVRCEAVISALEHDGKTWRDVEVCLGADAAKALYVLARGLERPAIGRLGYPLWQEHPPWADEVWLRR